MARDLIPHVDYDPMGRLNIPLMLAFSRLAKVAAVFAVAAGLVAGVVIGVGDFPLGTRALICAPALVAIVVSMLALWARGSRLVNSHV